MSLRCLITSAADAVSFPFQWLVAGLAWQGATKRRTEGIVVGVLEEHEAAADVIARIEHALRLIREFDPRLYDRVSRNLPRLAVTPRLRASYWHRFRVCVIGMEQVRRWHASQLASIIVHEATHAWLRNKGLPSSTANTKWRIERICTRAQLRLARKLPDSSRMVEYLYLQTREWTKRGSEIQ